MDNGNSSELVVYRASAGSGKTFTLAVEYIRLLVEQPLAYRNILAVTFTNKATAEMKERILSQLYGIAVKDKESESYLRQVMALTHFSENTVRANAREALNNIIHDYSRFYVETIDTFSVSVMRNLARELGVGTNMNIELNISDVLSETVDSMIESLDEGAEVLGWLSEYIMERIEDDKGWRVFDNIKTFAQQIFNETFIEDGQTLRQQLRDPVVVARYKGSLSNTRRTTLEQLSKYGEEFFALIAENDISLDDFKGKSRCPAVGFFTKLRDGDIDSIKISPTLVAMADNSSNWAKEGSPKYDELKSLADSRLTKLLSAAKDGYERYISCSLTLEYINDIRLLAHIDEEMKELNRVNNRFLLSNINELLHVFVKNDDTPFVFEKMGASICHIMMDEFQDTSRLQWNNFRPLLINGLSQGNNSLIVGDVKQSIYRWRNGDWNILNSELRDYFESSPIRSETLQTNRRSARAIIEFNNNFFERAWQSLCDKNRDECGENVKLLEYAYSDVRQECVDTSARGYVKVLLLPADQRGKEKKYVKNTIELLAQQVEELIAHKVAQKDIAILLRKKKYLAAIAEYFSRYTSYTLVSDEAYRLDTSAAVGIIIDALRCLSLPHLCDEENKLIIAKTAIAYRREAKKEKIDLNTILLSPAADILDKYMPKKFTERIGALLTKPLYELVEELYSIFELSNIADQDGYICTFFDAITDYCNTHSTELTHFIAYWDETLCSDTIPIGEVDGIRVLTIHKAKGLEYHTVLVPFCDWTMGAERVSSSSSSKVWCKPAAPYNGLDLVPIRYKEDMASSIYAKDYYNEKLQLCVDNLNLLYVAFTRAKENLFVWSQYSKDDSDLNKVSKLLQHVLAIKEENGTYEYGELQRATPTPQAQKTNRLLIHPESISITLQTMETSYEVCQSNGSAEFIDATKKEGREYIDRGLFLHNLFSALKTKEDVVPVVERLRFDGLIQSKEQEEEIRAKVEAVLDSPLAEEWFDGTWELFNECSIIYMEDGTTQTRRPDRVMIKDGNVVVVDYKFGKKREAYHQQVREYMCLLNKMGYSNVKGYLWYVDANDVEEVRYE